jgi:signal transduction histidine kinase
MISCSSIGPLQINRIGVAGEDLSRNFDRFERVETDGTGRIAGTDLRLSIAREIASQ